MPFATGLPPQSGNKIDVTSLTPFNGEAVSVAATGAFQTILSIRGKGFLESAYSATSNAVAHTIRITVDGVVKVLLSTSTTDASVGVATKNDLYGNATSVFPRAGGQFIASTAPTAPKSYPITDGSSGLIVLGNTPIYFYQSLLIEISQVSGVYRYQYCGGFKS